MGARASVGAGPPPGPQDVELAEVGGEGRAAGGGAGAGLAPPGGAVQVGNGGGGEEAALAQPPPQPPPQPQLQPQQHPPPRRDVTEGGLYFGDHYLLRDGRGMGGGHAFGEVGPTANDNFGFGPAPRIGPGPPRMQGTKAIRSNVNVKKGSVALKRVLDGVYTLSTVVDARVAVEVSVFYMATEELNPDTNISTFHSSLGFESRPILVRKGLGRAVDQTVDNKPLSVAQLTGGLDVLLTATDSVYPIVIVAKTTQPGAEPQYQYTYGVVKSVSGPGERLEVQVLKQKLVVEGRAYLLQEIYGVDGADGNECVVCMSDPRETVILPCRHMCLCSECAEDLRTRSNKCPICRAPFFSLMTMKVKKSAKMKGDDDGSGGGSVSGPAVPGLAVPGTGVSASVQTRLPVDGGEGTGLSVSHATLL